MATYSGKIDSYTCNILSPKVYVGKRLMNVTGTYGAALLWFLPDSAALPDNRKRSGQNVFDIYYRINDWEAILDILRNEGPVYFNFSDTSNAAQIYTGKEPVGEEETKTV